MSKNNELETNNELVISFGKAESLPIHPIEPEQVYNFNKKSLSYKRLS